MSERCPKCGSAVEKEDTACPQCRTILLREDASTEETTDSKEVLSVGAVLADEYRIVRLLGRGGAGIVYEARQISLQDMRVAVKVVHRDFNSNDNCINLLKKEVIIARELTHENIIKVFSLEKVDEQYFIVMEYVPGKSLQALLNRYGRIPLKQFTPIFFQVCDALEYAHDRGIVHLDIKPANILVGKGVRVKLCDFGIARMAMGDTTTATQRLITGSVGYMPPEQYTGRGAVSPRSDIYALGATVHRVLTGKLPVGAFSPAGVPTSVFRAIQSNPEERFESVAEFRAAFIRDTGMGATAPGVHVDRKATQSEQLKGGLSPKAGRWTISKRTRADDSAGESREARENRRLAGVAATNREVEATREAAGLDEAVLRKSDSEPGRRAGGFSRKKAALIVVVAALVAGLAATVVLVREWQLARQKYSPAEYAPYQVAVSTLEWLDPDRNREVPVKIYAPATGEGPFPAVIFSHGFGGSRDSAEFLGRHWASHGYISFHIQHKGTDQGAIDNAPRPREALRRMGREVQNMVNRPLDVSFSIGQMERINKEDGPFTGQIDLERLGMAGPSLGAFTTLAAAGQLFRKPDGTETSFADHRIKAAIVMSPPMPGLLKLEAHKAFKGIIIPCLHITGTADRGPGDGTPQEDRRVPFDHIDGADQYLIVFRGMDLLGPFAPRAGGPGRRDPRLTALIQMSSTAFWDAYLKGDPGAKSWLDDGGLESALGREGTLEKKLKAGR